MGFASKIQQYGAWMTRATQEETLLVNSGACVLERKGRNKCPQPKQTNKQPQNKNTNLSVVVSFYLSAGSDLELPEKRAAIDELSGSG